MSADGKSQLEGLWDTLSSAVFSTYDAYGWIIPALLLTALLLGLIVLAAYALEDLPFDSEIFHAIGGIFKWTRRCWRGERVASPRED